MKYPPYPRYKASGVDWLGEIPEHWEVRRNRFLFRERDERLKDDSAILFSLSKDKGLVPRSDITDKEARADTLAGYKRFYPGDIVMNKMQAWNGIFGFSKDSFGIVSPDYTVLSCKSGLEPQYFTELFRTPSYVAQFLMSARGMGTAFLRLNTNDFGDIPALLPSSDEQKQISNFISSETAKIDALISEQERLTGLLQEKRQALISHTVTKGLNPDVPMKDSGIKWLGKVPAHWIKTCVKRLASDSAGAIVDGPFGSSINVEIDYVEEGVPVIRTVNITDEGFSRKELKFMRREKFAELKRHAVHPGDLLFSKVGTIGNTCLLPSDIHEAILSTTGSCKITLDEKKSQPEFVVYLFQGLKNFFLFLASANVQPFLNLTTIGNVELYLPPLEEQMAISNYIRNKTTTLNLVIEKARESIALSKEHRATLISTAVTGKIDVRQYGNGDLSDN